MKRVFKQRLENAWFFSPRDIETGRIYYDVEICSGVYVDMDMQIYQDFVEIALGEHNRNPGWRFYMGSLDEINTTINALVQARDELMKYYQNFSNYERT